MAHSSGLPGSRSSQGFSEEIPENLQYHSEQDQVCTIVPSSQGLAFSYPIFSRDLSNGFFSADNQKRLIGPSTEVPVFEAKMTRDLRLVVTPKFLYLFRTTNHGLYP